MAVVGAVTDRALEAVVDKIFGDTSQFISVPITEWEHVEVKKYLLIMTAVYITTKDSKKYVFNLNSNERKKWLPQMQELMKK